MYGSFFKHFLAFVAENEIPIKALVTDTVATIHPGNNLVERITELEKIVADLQAFKASQVIVPTI